MVTKKKPPKTVKKPVNFYVWLRSGLRSLSRKWPPIFEALADAKVPYKGDNKRRQWSYKCAMCLGEFESKQVSVDHRIPTGSMLGKEDIADFVEKLFCPSSALQVLCDDCHSCKSYSEKNGCTMEEAKIAKAVIAIMKDKKKCLAMLEEHEYNCKNDTQRRAALTEILTKEKL